MNEIVIRQTADKDVREYHVSEELTDAPYWQVLNSELDSSENFSRFGDNASKLLRSMNNQGIIKVTLRPHSLKLTKESSATWGQVEGSIISAFETTFGTVKPVHYSKATRQKVMA